MAKRPGFTRIEFELPDDVANELKAMAKVHWMSVAMFCRLLVLEEIWGDHVSNVP